MRVVAGTVVRAHGVRGEVVVAPRTDRPDQRFSVGATLRTADGPPLTVRSARRHGDRWLIRFRGVGDRAAADRLRGAALEVDLDPSDVPGEPDVFPDAVLVGMRVVDAADADVGTVSAVEHLPMQDLLVVRCPDGRDVRVPFVREIVPDVSTQDRTLRVTPPDGLLAERDAG